MSMRTDTLFPYTTIFRAVRRRPGPRRCGRRASGIGPVRSDRFQRPSLHAARELEQLLRACQIWTVEHAAFVADRADAGIGGEQNDDLLRRRDLGFVRHESFVDYIDLYRMNRDHAAKAGAAALRGALAQEVGSAHV